MEAGRTSAGQYQHARDCFDQGLKIAQQGDVALDWETHRKRILSHPECKVAIRVQDSYRDSRLDGLPPKQWQKFKVFIWLGFELQWEKPHSYEEFQELEKTLLLADHASGGGATGTVQIPSPAAGEVDTMELREETLNTYIQSLLQKGSPWREHPAVIQLVCPSVDPCDTPAVPSALPKAHRWDLEQWKFVANIRAHLEADSIAEASRELDTAMERMDSGERLYADGSQLYEALEEASAELVSAIQHKMSARQTQVLVSANEH